MNPEQVTDREIDILSHIARGKPARQRDLSHVIGISLGMTNVVLKRLIRKGYLVVRTVNKRKLAYVVTPAGVDAIARRSYRYLRRTVRNIVYFRSSIEVFLHDVRSRGYRGIAFAGTSDLDFIVEYACDVCGIRYFSDDASIESAKRGLDGLFLVYSERYIPDENVKAEGGSVAFLQEVVGQLPGQDAVDEV
jgi:DNA-binding MarR family transcriptional regulator